MLRIQFLLLIALLLGTSAFGASPIPDGSLLQLDANSLTGYNNGDVVSTWPDLSGWNRNATSTGTPTYIANALNGHPAISITGSLTLDGYSWTGQDNDYYAFDAIPNTTTIAMVFKRTSNVYYSGGATLFGNAPGGLWQDPAFAFDSHWGTAYFNYETSTTWHPGYTDPSVAYSTIDINGVSIGAGNGGWTAVPTNYHIMVLAIQNGWGVNLQLNALAATIGQGHTWGMDVAELIVYDRFLTATEKNNLGYYLKTKYNITATNYTFDSQPFVYNSRPVNGKSDLSGTSTTLTWDVAHGTAPTATVWFGHKDNMTQRATGLTAHNWTTPTLSPETIYEWRIDLVDGGVTYTGKTWSFRTILPATKVIDWGLESTSSAAVAHQTFIAANHISATASDQTNGWASSTLSDDGLYGMGLIAYPHGYSWITDLNGGTNPALWPVNNSNYYWGAWIEYTFDATYTIGNMYVWNQNQIGLTNRGLQNVAIDYSVNGTTWTTLGGVGHVYTIPQATGLNGMTPSATINFGGAIAKYVVITAQVDGGQYGSDPGKSDTYYALGKVRFGLNGTTAADVTTPDSAGYLSSGYGIVQGSPQIVQGMSTTDSCMNFSGDSDAVVSNVLGSTFPAAGIASWSMNVYVYIPEELNQYDIVAGFGAPENFPDGARRCIMNYGRATGTHNNRIYFWGQSNDLATNTPFDIAQWQMITVTYDGLNLKIYKNGNQIASKMTSGFADAAPVVNLGVRYGNPNAGKFKGKIDNFTIYKGVLSQSEITTLAQTLPLAGNFNRDARVDFKDYAIFGQKWLTNTQQGQPTLMLADMEGANALDAWSVPSEWNTGVATVALTTDQPFAGSQAIRMTYDNSAGANQWSSVDFTLPAAVDMSKYDLLRIHVKRHVGNSREQSLFVRGYSPEGTELFTFDETYYSTDGTLEPNAVAGVWEKEDGIRNGNVNIWYNEMGEFAHQVAKLKIGAKQQTGSVGGTGIIDIDNIQLEKFNDCVGTIQEGDFNADCVIDVKDVLFFVNNWLRSE